MLHRCYYSLITDLERDLDLDLDLDFNLHPPNNFLTGNNFLSVFPIFSFVQVLHRFLVLFFRE